MDNTSSAKTKSRFHPSQHKSASAILFIFTLLTLYNSILLPLGEAPDETDHYQYHRFVARHGHPPFTTAERDEAGFKGGLAPLYYWLTAWPIAIIGEQTTPDIRRVDGRPERFIPTDGLGINRVLHTLDEQWPWRGQPLAWHWVRLFSLPMAWVTLLAIYALARRLFPNQPQIAIGTLIFAAFLPRFVISSAVINDDNLVFALTALLLLTQVIILQGNHSLRIFGIFGTLFGLALITKYFSLILLPEILLTLFLFIRMKPHQIWRPLGTFLLFLTLSAGPWFIFIILRFNQIDTLGFIPGLAAALGEPQITEGLVGLLSGQSVRPPAATFALPEWLGLLYRSFWFEYGWMRIFAPFWVYLFFTLFLLLALSGLIHKITVYLPPPQSPPKGGRLSGRGIYLLLVLHLALFLIVVAARYILSATIDTGQGRHLYPALPVIALGVAVGLTAISSKIKDIILPQLSHNLLPQLAITIVLLLFLMPAFIALQPAAFILSHYETLPITTQTLANRAIEYPNERPVTASFSLLGFATPTLESAGNALPVTLYWQVQDQVNQDYLVSLCLQDEAAQPVACVRQHFVNGRYPARAWEAGDTLLDTMFIPIPVCYRLLDQPYTLHLELWPLRLDQAAAMVEDKPIFEHTFTTPQISLHPTDSLLTNYPPATEWWRANERLTQPTKLKFNETLSQITYQQASSEPAPPPLKTETNQPWPSLSGFDTSLYLPCDEGPTPFAQVSHFIASPTVAPGLYQPTSAADSADFSIQLNTRPRALSASTIGLNFANTLTPLSLQLAQQPPLNLDTGIIVDKSPVNLQSPISSLPLTIRWHTQQWMADPLIISLKLLDKDFNIGGERVTTLGDRYPNVLWVPGERVEETYPLQIKPDAPPGLYQLEFGLIRQDKNLTAGFAFLPILDGDKTPGQTLYPLTVRLLDPHHQSTPEYPFSAQLGKDISLIGYDLDPKSQIVNRKSKISLALYWQSTAPIPTDYTVFTQLLGPDGQAWAQWDNPPQAGRYPTSAWAGTDRVVDRYELALREGAPPGDYKLLVGMYNPLNAERIPATINSQPQPNQAIELATLSLAP